ncbi:MAG: hypothetical protein FWG53_10160 [Clostridiales bacterium]|nr:hypothetical protein [Clostridiales bacterium]
MRSNEEIAAEALRRSAASREKKAVRRQRVYAMSAACACIAVIVGLSLLLPSMPESVVSGMPSTAGAAVLAGSGAGGYVLMGIIGFVLGVAAVLISIKAKKG